jgi:tRNA dimethylallyltransferase
MLLTSKTPLIVLVGPTGVGKTEVSIPLAERLSAEIISADSRLFYRGMDVGTAKPTPADMQRVRHHLIDIADPESSLGLAVFQHLAGEAISGVQARGHLPMLVGGTGQYVRAVTQGWQPPLVQPNEKLRRLLDALGRERGGACLHAWLQRLDPVAAQKIDARNVRRIVRALEVIFATGRMFSAQSTRGDSPVHLVIIGLRRQRKELYERIDNRIENMFSLGLLREVRELLSRGYSADLPAMSAIGYREAIRVIQGEINVEHAKIEMRRATRAFVRRQSNWFKESDPRIHWFDAAAPSTLDGVEAFVRAGLHDRRGSLPETDQSV